MRANDHPSSAARLSGFDSTTLWHRRLARVGLTSRVHPRVLAELILRPVGRTGHDGQPVAGSKGPDDARRAA